MTITLYRISDDNRQLVKTTDNDHKLGDLTAHFKSDVDILNPVLEIAYSGTYATANYVYVSEWGRYYFVRNITTGAQRMFLECAIDVLMTYSAQIKNLECVLARQESKNNSNLFLQDGMFKVLQPKDVVVLPWDFTFDKKGSFVLAVGGDI